MPRRASSCPQQAMLTAPPPTTKNSMTQVVTGPRRQIRAIAKMRGSCASVRYHPMSVMSGLATTGFPFGLFEDLPNSAPIAHRF